MKTTMRHKRRIIRYRRQGFAVIDTFRLPGGGRGYQLEDLRYGNYLCYVPWERE